MKMQRRLSPRAASRLMRNLVGCTNRRRFHGHDRSQLLVTKVNWKASTKMCVVLLAESDSFMISVQDYMDLSRYRVYREIDLHWALRGFHARAEA